VHRELDLTNVADTVVARGHYRIDGKGDDEANAMVELDLAVPISFINRH
jgi:hypothetical protein